MPERNDMVGVICNRIRSRHSSFLSRSFFQSLFLFLFRCCILQFVRTIKAKVSLFFGYLILKKISIRDQNFSATILTYTHPRRNFVFSDPLSKLKRPVTRLCGKICLQLANAPAFNISDCCLKCENGPL